MGANTLRLSDWHRISFFSSLLLYFLQFACTVQQYPHTLSRCPFLGIHAKPCFQHSYLFDLKDHHLFTFSSPLSSLPSSLSFPRFPPPSSFFSLTSFFCSCSFAHPFHSSFLLFACLHSTNDQSALIPTPSRFLSLFMI